MFYPCCHCDKFSVVDPRISRSTLLYRCAMFSTKVPTIPSLHFAAWRHHTPVIAGSYRCYGSTEKTIGMKGSTNDGVSPTTAKDGGSRVSRRSSPHLKATEPEHSYGAILMIDCIVAWGFCWLQTSQLMFSYDVPSFQLP